MSRIEHSVVGTAGCLSDMGSCSIRSLETARVCSAADSCLVTNSLEGSVVIKDYTVGYDVPDEW